MKNTDLPTTEDTERLLSLQNSDRGFFVLALYSFIEGYLRKRYGLQYEDARFSDLIELFIRDLNGSMYVSSENFGCLKDLSRNIANANKVRHNWQQLSIEELRASIYQFKRFAELSDFYSIGQLSTLDRNLDDWMNRKSNRDLRRELEDSAAAIRELSKTNKSLSLQVVEYDRLRDTLAHLEAANASISRELDDLKSRTSVKDKKYDELRKEKFAEQERVRKEIGALKEKGAELADARKYLEALSRVTVYTRTRLDFERTLLRLSVEQEKVLEQIRLGKDFLIKGSAGTGKSLVLIKALEKALSRRTESLGLEEQESVVLLTYTRSLVAYTRYISSLLKIGDPSDIILTADSFLIRKFRKIAPQGSVVFARDDVLSCFDHATDAGLSDKDLYAEAETFIWANMITEEEYVTRFVPRTGMKKPIRAEQRKLVWTAAALAAKRLEEAGTWTKSLAALRIVRSAADIADADRSDYVFIDEAQDLPAVEIAAIKKFARRSAILAGDADQSIYQSGFSWRRAGIDIAGRARILHTNFRNTVQLHEFAERYRKTIPGMDGENSSDAFRFGIPPEWSSAKTTEDLYEQILQKVQVCLKYLEYDPENICIIAPKADHLARLAAEVHARFDIPAAVIKDDQFRFEDRGVIRLSTMHSSKGLDFPVVLFLLDHRPHGLGPYDEETTDRMTRNLIYVSITRAMEQLHVFTLEDADAPAILDLVNAVK